MVKRKTVISYRNGRGWLFLKKEIDRAEKIWYAECRGNRIDARE